MAGETAARLGNGQQTFDADPHLALARKVVLRHLAFDDQHLVLAQLVALGVEHFAVDRDLLLRRAIVEARLLGDAERPVLIAFNIPEDEAEGWDSALDIWKIEINSSLIETTIFRRLNGDIIIDGSTQPGGRSAGPKILIVGPGTGQKDGLVVGDVAGDNNHVIRGLGFQNLKTHIFLNTDNNLIEDCWFGLSDDGTGLYLRGGNEDDGSGNTGISVACKCISL